jgi:hypothetical protein
MAIARSVKERSNRCVRRSFMLFAPAVDRMMAISDQPTIRIPRIS